MDRVITFSFCESFLDHVVRFMEDRYLRPGRDLGRVAMVFGGKRPALFLKRALAQKIRGPFVPPRLFTIDEFIGQVIEKHEPFQNAGDLDHCYLLFTLARQLVPDVLKDRQTFARFLPWAREILRFIEQLDLEAVEDATLANVKAHAEIGYAVPDNINRLLQDIVVLRRAYHDAMRRSGTYARGYRYRRAAELVARTDFSEWDEVLFCNVFYLNRSEQAVMKNLYDRGQAWLLVQGDARKWPVFERMARAFQCPVREGDVPPDPRFELKVYSGFDLHSQVGLVRHIVRGAGRLEDTVIVLPDAQHLVPLLSELAAEIRDFNVSMGYPLKRSSLYALFEFVFAAQENRSAKGYYARDYLKVLRHPLVKNLNLTGNTAATRVLAHKIEEALTGQAAADISGLLFVPLDAVLGSTDLRDLTLATLERMGTPLTAGEWAALVSGLHRLLFALWENVATFKAFSAALEEFMDVLAAKSNFCQYPLNMKIAGRMAGIREELAAATFAGETFPADEIFRIFANKMDREIVAFSGSPLKGLQILGLFETRALNFKQVIIMDVNEKVLPHVNIYEPLIPREVMISLNLDRLEQEEEIQRYQFMRLISSAETVHLVYQESREKERSRFVEELLWEEEKKARQRGVVKVVRPGFEVKPASAPEAVPKNAEVLAVLKGLTYSASSLNMYVRNPMDFYYNYVLGLREKEDLLDEPENRQVGIFVHELLEEAFKPFVGRKPVIDAAFKVFFQRLFHERFERTFGRSMKADAFLLKTVLEARLAQFLKHEAESPARQVEQVLFIEQRFKDRIALAGEEIAFVYRVDRVDRMKDGTVMLLDYKTGSVDPMPQGIGVLERMALSRQTVFDHVRSFQIPLYFHYLKQRFPGEPVNTAFYNLRTLELNPFVHAKNRDDLDRLRNVFTRALDYVVGEIMDPGVPFANDPL